MHYTNYKSSSSGYEFVDPAQDDHKEQTDDHAYPFKSVPVPCAYRESRSEEGLYKCGTVVDVKCKQNDQGDVVDGCDTQIPIKKIKPFPKKDDNVTVGTAVSEVDENAGMDMLSADDDPGGPPTIPEKEQDDASEKPVDPERSEANQLLLGPKKKKEAMRYRGIMKKPRLIKLIVVLL